MGTMGGGDVHILKHDLGLQFGGGGGRGAGGGGGGGGGGWHVMLHAKKLVYIVYPLM